MKNLPTTSNKADKPNANLIQTLTHFLHHSTHTQLQITFASLNICNSQHGKLLQRLPSRQGRIGFQKLSPQLLQLDIMDSLVFRFSIQCPIHQPVNLSDMGPLSLPRPLDQGSLYVDEEKLVLSFRIDAPDPLLRIQVTHNYQGIYRLEEYCTPLCGHATKV
ncbi:hypothetical protein [Allomuricauda sp. ARW1Y1]|uniref:hypothetical protein n=1 Tax=Allomuricauda sp. ARW1Y1 TaxID=2663843 RepID=UPI0015C6FEBD|nr:hypothetical protein [Muricauda sp. ARW1Y1]NYJ25973.1 hypothetical protein [Muricauda sp. ARW1Y1]